LCERTISKLILDRINTPAILDLPARQFKDLPELLFKLNAPLCRDLLNKILPELSLLDPSCGSGAFLVAAMKTLIDVYSAIIGKIEFLNDESLNNWLKEIRQNHPNIHYFIKKEIIKNNLYGVDIMPEATEIAKLRLFLALVSSAQKVDDLEPLPNIDFNIMAGNSLIGLLNVEGEKFNAIGKSGDIFADSGAQTYQQILQQKNRLIASYKDSNTFSENLTELRDKIVDFKTKAYRKLNALLLAEFERLQIKYEQATWDDAKNKEGKPEKRALTPADISELKPFHWGFEFDQIFARGGFDAIITNPPWEVHHGFRFCLLTFEKGGSTDKFNAVFRINPREAIAAEKLANFLNNAEIQLKLSADLVKKLSPDSQSIMEFKNETDIIIAEKMLAFPLLGEKLDDTWNLKLTSEFNMTTDSHLFKTENAKGRLPLFEGKMIHQFSSTWGEPKYWIDEAEGRKGVLGLRKEDVGQVLDYQCYRLAFRDVAASTNERTMIATILPRNVFCPHTMSLENVENSNINSETRLFLIALFNSFILDSIIRQRVTSHVSFFFVYNLPIPRLTETDPRFKKIVERAAALICVSAEFEDLKQELVAKGYELKTDAPDVLRAELDAMVAKLYDLTADEFAHILKTFPIVKDEVKVAAMDEFRKLENVK
jgi:hypothetical protein